MSELVSYIIIAVISYFIGSTPTGFVFGKVLKGVDIREHGSGNMGATNVFRVIGKGPGAVVLILDIIKGVLAVVFIAGAFHPSVEGRIVAAIAVVAGHNWTCFLKFKGGKGVATSLGVLIGLMIVIKGLWLPVLLCLSTWIVFFLLTAIVSISSIIAGISLPIYMVVFDAPFLVNCLSFLFALFVVFRHRPNIERLLAGNESTVPLPWKRQKENLHS